MAGLEATLPVIRDLIAVGEEVMWIVGPGEMVSENTSRGIREPYVHEPYITVSAHNWRFHLEPELVSGIQFVETYGDLRRTMSASRTGTAKRWYGRICQRRPTIRDGNQGREITAFDEMRARYEGSEGVEYVRREVLMSSFR